MIYNLKYSRFNERSILIEWPAVIDENVLKSILKFKKDIQNYYIKQKVDIINTYNSILIIYDFTIDNINDRILTLKSLFDREIETKKFKSCLWEIPACYDEEFGIDTEYISNIKSLSKPEIIHLHSQTIYTVFFIGFLPGFLYLGGLNPKLFFDRKITPNLNVEKGAIGIGGKQTGIYPQDSPGGWHIIGKTPVELFNSNQDPPCFIEAGDKVKFKPVNKSEYFDILDAVKTSVYQLKPLNVYV